MTTGMPTRLSEKLNADLDAIRRNHVALTEQQLQSFRSDLSGIAKNALDTIEIDTQHFLYHNQKWFEERTSQMRDWLSMSPWVIGGLIVVGIASMMVVSWIWVTMLTHSEMAEMGLKRVNLEGRNWMILDPNVTAIKTCTLAEKTVFCIQIREQ